MPPRAAASSTAAWMAAVSMVTPSPTAPWSVTSTTPPRPPPGAGDEAAPAPAGKAAIAAAPPASAAAEASSRRRGIPGGSCRGLSSDSFGATDPTVAARPPGRASANRR